MLRRRLSLALICVAGVAIGLAVLLWPRSEDPPRLDGVLFEVPGRSYGTRISGRVYKNGTEIKTVFNSDTYNDHTISVLTLAAPYTNVEFDIRGTTCGSYYSVSHNSDEFSADATVLGEEDQEVELQTVELGEVLRARSPQDS